VLYKIHYNNGYILGFGFLVMEWSVDRKVEMVLDTFKRLEGSIGEDEYHMIHKNLDDSNRGLGFEYSLVFWRDVDEGFNSKYGAVPFSSELHRIIEGLVSEGVLSRSPSDPIVLVYDS